MFCALSDTARPCVGDSGSPLIFRGALFGEIYYWSLVERLSENIIREETSYTSEFQIFNMWINDPNVCKRKFKLQLVKLFEHWMEKLAEDSIYLRQIIVEKWIIISIVFYSNSSIIDDVGIYRYHLLEPILWMAVSNRFHSHNGSERLDHECNRYTLIPYLRIIARLGMHYGFHVILPTLQCVFLYNILKELWVSIYSRCSRMLNSLRIVLNLKYMLKYWRKCILTLHGK